MMTAASSVLCQSRKIVLDFDTSSSDVYVVEDDMELQLDSPSSASSSSDQTYRPSCSTSSVDGSRPGSDRFVLVGDFSSCESEAFISGTSESSDTEGVQPLEKLKTMLRTNGPIMPSKRGKTQVIVISSSSEGSDDDDEDDADPLQRFFLHSSTPLPESYIVNIPLSQLKSCPSVKPRKVPAKLALSHFATTRKKQSNESSGEEFFTPMSELPKSLSMKLKKSGSGNQWQSILLSDTQSPVSSPIIADSHTPMTSSPLLSKQTIPAVTNPSKLKMSPFVTVKRQFNNSSQQTAIVQTAMPISRATRLQSGSVTSSGPPSVTSDPTEGVPPEVMSSDHQDDDLVSVSSSSSQTVTNNGGPSFRPITAAPRPKVSHGPVNVKKVNTTICFEELFTFYPSSLAVIDGELKPVNSLSLKGVEIVPRDHPIHKWKMGKLVLKNHSGRPGPKRSRYKNVSTVSY